MRTLIVSDIHSNIVALDAVLRDARVLGPIDVIWSLGDMVGYGPRPNECLDTLRRFPHVSVAGNHDLGAIGTTSLDVFNADAAMACMWSAAQLTPENRAFLEELPSVVREGDFTLVHASLRDPVWEYVVHEGVARESFALLETRVLLLGHSHLPLLFEEVQLTRDVRNKTRLAHDSVLEVMGEPRLIINPGSVGQPRDGDPRAGYAILDHEAGTLTHLRAEYDIEFVQRDMKAAGLPLRLAQRLSYGF